MNDETLKTVNNAAYSSAFSVILQQTIDKYDGIQRTHDEYLEYREQEFKRICLEQGVDIDSMNKANSVQ